VILASIDFHGAHPQFNLFEGNVGNNITMDSFWGSGSNNTTFRNLFRGTDTLASPLSAGRNVVNWSSTQLAGQQTRGITVAFPHTNANLVGNVLGSYDQTQVGPTCTGYDCGTSPWAYNAGSAPYTSTLLAPATRYYGCHANACQFQAVNIGYDTGSDGSGTSVASFAGGPSNAVGYWVGKASGSTFQHGNFDTASSSIIWNGSTTEAMPASFYRSSKPTWFGSVPWPAIGPDVTGGAMDSSTLAGHVNAIPAEVCYSSTPRDAYGLKQFDPSVCYYGASAASLPVAPTGLKATAN
jgi:hypothetical protein